jgi:hypothetical protein
VLIPSASPTPPTSTTALNGQAIARLKRRPLTILNRRWRRGPDRHAATTTVRILDACEPGEFVLHLLAVIESHARQAPNSTFRSTSSKTYMHYCNLFVMRWMERGNHSIESAVISR